MLGLNINKNTTVDLWLWTNLSFRQTNKQKDVLEIVLHLEWNSRIPALILIACLAWLQNKLFKLQRHLFYPPHRIIRKEINPEYSLKGLMLKLKLQYFGHLMRRADSLEKILMLERLKANGEGGDRGCDSWMASSTQWTQFEQTLGDSEGQGSLMCYSPWGCKS